MLKTMTTPVDLDEIERAAKSAPVVVMKGNERSFVAVAPEEFDRLTELDRKRRIEAGRRLTELMDKIAARVAERATPAEIAAIERELIDED